MGVKKLSSILFFFDFVRLKLSLNVCLLWFGIIVICKPAPSKCLPSYIFILSARLYHIELIKMRRYSGLL